MERLENQLPNKAHVSSFLQLNCSNFRLKSVECLRVTKIFKKINFEGVWGELEPKKGFQRNSFQKHLY